jgi:TP901 family phage tail tape measure protein
MAEVQSNIRVNVDTTSAVASLRLLQNQISAFHTQMSKAGAAPAAVSSNMQQNLLNGINASGKFAASMVTVKSSTEAFTTALEKNKLSMGEYFRYAGGASKSFGKLFASEFATINQVAESRVKSLQSQYIKMGRDANGALQAIKVRPLSLDMNDLATRTALAAQKQQLLNQLLHQGSTNLLNFGKNTQWAGRQLMVGFSIPLLMVASAATKAYTQMETASLKLRRVYGDLNTTEAETRQITASITKLGHEFTKFGIAVSDTMDLASQIAAMGKTGNDLLQQVAETQRLVALGGVSTADAMQTTVALTNAFGVSTKDLATNVDFLNYAQNQTILSIQDVTEAIPKAGPVVKQLGGDVKDLTFFMTAMREGGISASQGANALKSGLASLINPSKAASDFLGTLGINITGIVNKDKGNLKQTVLDVATALDKLDPLNRARAIEKLFGKFQFSRMSALLQNVADPNSQAAQILNIANKSKAELSILSERELNRVANSPMNKFKKAQQELKTSLVPLGEQFMTAVIPLTKFLTTFIKGFNDLNKNSGGFFSNLTMWVAGIGPVVLMAIGLLANGVANIIKLFANVKSFINRTQTESRVLGETTHYMTKEQIDAKAAAVSLEQAHVNLAQAFSTERENLSLLVSEYQRAIAIQEAYAATNLIPRGPMGPMPKGYATGGVVQGPGGPTDDAVPTNLSNGEVVLSVATVKKNPGIVKALLGGKKIRIPNLSGGGQPGGVILPAGYAADIGNPNKNYASIPTNAAKMEAAGFGTQVQKVVNILAEFGVTTSTASGMFRNMNTAAKMGEAELNKWVAALEQNVQIAKTGTQLKAMQKTSTGVGVGDKQQESFAHVGGGTSYQSAITGQKVIAKSQLGMSGIPIDLNRQLAQGGANPKEFLKAYDTAGVQKWNDSVRAGGGNIEKLSGDISVFDARIKQLISTSGANKIFDSEAQAKAYGPGAISVQGAYNQARREQIGGGLTSALDVAHASPRDSREGGSKSKMFTADPARRAEASTHLAAAAKAELEVVGQNIGTESSKAVTSGVVKSVDKNSRSASPSKLGAELSGKNIVDGIMLPVKEAKPQADAAGKALGSAFIKPMVEASKQPLVKKSMPQFFGAGSTALTAANINRSNAVVSTPVPPTALQNAKANLAREGAWLKEEWAAIINPMKATLSAAKGQITSDAVFIEGNLKKAFSAVVPESSAMGQAFQQLKAIMTVARGNFLTEWEWIKEDFLGGTKAMKAGAVDIEAEMLRVGKAFNVTNRIAQFQVAMGDFGAILTKGSLSAVKAGIAQQAVAQQQGIWGSFTAKIKSIGSAISGIGARAVSATTGAISGAKSGVVGAANALGLRGNLESQLAAQMALAKTQKATIMQTVEKTRLMTEEDKQLVQLISAEQKLTEARIVELKTMLQAPTVFQQISNKLAEIGTIGQAGASKVNAAASQMFTFIGNKFTDLMNSGRPAAAALIEFQRAQKEAAVATRELEAAQRKGIATEEQRAIAANATARVDAARMGVNQTKTNIKGLGGISMGLMMAPMMLSQDKGAVGKFVNKNMMNIMMASMLIPMINPFINGVRSMATRMVLFANKSKLAEVAAAELAAGQKAAAGAQAAATGAVEAKTAAEEANTAATIAQTEVDATRVAEESALAVAEGAQVAEVTALDAAQGVLVGETVALDAATGVEVAEVVTLDGALALLEIPIIAVTAGLIGLVAIIAGGIWAFNAYNEEQNKQRKAGINMAKATAMTTDKLIALSKITKTVSATEAAARTRSDAYNAAVGVKDTSIGKKLLGSSFGKSTIADVKTMQANGMSQEEIGKNMASSLLLWKVFLLQIRLSRLQQPSVLSLKI